MDRALDFRPRWFRVRIPVGAFAAYIGYPRFNIDERVKFRRPFGYPCARIARRWRGFRAC